MKIIRYPGKEIWETLCIRPGFDRSGLENVVSSVLQKVRNEGDRALFELTEKFDGAVIKDLRVSASEIREAADTVPENFRNANSVAMSNIEKFHRAQLIGENPVETTKGVKCWRKSVPISKAGIYVPGGTAPLFSTVLMLAVPAKIAGCSEIILCTPPDKNGKINPLILYAAFCTGVTDIYKIGGAQAVAAMAYGTESVPRVDKIFGPGNQYVTKAKELVQQDGTAIDMPAGPSEVLVIADQYADPEFIASDLISQAEHGPDSQVIMLTDNQDIIKNVRLRIDEQLQLLPRKATALKSLENSRLILLESLDDCIDFSNHYAPEHLIINTLEANTLADKVINAGSVFIGSYSCESAGDYATGTNHTLPTNGFAKNYSGVSTESFLKKISFQQVSPEGLRNLGPAIELMAEAELLYGHKNAVSIRLKKTEND